MSSNAEDPALNVGLAIIQQLERDGHLIMHPPGWKPPPVTVDDFPAEHGVTASNVLNRAKVALAGVTPGPWTHHTAPSAESDETPAQYCANTLAGNGDPVHVLTAASPDPKFAYVIPALTGDGPTSAINAEFIAQARELVPEMITELERLYVDSRLLGQANYLLAKIVAAANLGAIDGADGFVESYNLPVGPIHKAIPFLNEQGISVTQDGQIQSARD